MNTAYIVAARRTAGGRRNGKLSGWHPADLAAVTLKAVMHDSGIDPTAIEDVIMGCVSQGGEQSFNIARNAVLAAGLPESVPATSVDRQCGSSQQALHFAAQAVMSGTMDCVVAAGVESMTRVPMFSTGELYRQAGMGEYTSPNMKARYPGVRFSQFTGAEMLARKYQFSKEQLDAYALLSHHRALRSTQAGHFQPEIVPLAVHRQGQHAEAELHTHDEGIRADATLESIAGVKLLQEGGVITAANASQICDGSAALMVASEAAIKTHGLKPLARIVHLSVLGHDPMIMLEAPIPATERALKKAGLSIQDIDLYEVNEAFAPVPLAWLQVLDADPDRLNVHGGAIALGHPLGASGAKLMTTLVHALQQRGARYGLQTMCEGGGMANVTVIERL
ncbi:MAG: acetyl-CoA C-acetyltransferase [Alphaproteobacteria bacterium]|nr:acetyl-CoA C-acetyltransferase [Alphaproteobacteria bacterium]